MLKVQNPSCSIHEVRRKLGRVTMLLLATFVVPSIAHAQLQVQTAVSEERPYVGDRVVFEVAVEQAVQDPPELEADQLEQIGFRALGQPSTGSSTTIINGVRTDRYTFRYRFAFTPDRAGPISIPSLTVRQGRYEEKTDPISIEVSGPEKQDWAIIEITPSDRTVYPGQSTTVTVRVLLRRLVHEDRLLDADPFDPNRPPHLAIPWERGTEPFEPTRGRDAMLERRANERGPSFTINELFQRRNLFAFFEDRIEQVPIRFDREAVRRKHDGETIEYYAYSLPLEFRATRPGTTAPLTAQLRGTVYTGVRRERQGLAPIEQPVFAISEPITLVVAAVPKAGQPNTFTGGVGLFKATATAQPVRVRVGDPLTLTLRVTGTGTLEELTAPDLSVQERWADHFKVHDAPSVRMEDGAKLFTYSVRPKTAEVAELPPIRLGFFNPKSKRYEEAVTARIPLEVQEADSLAMNEIIHASGGDDLERPIEELAAGLAPNYTGPNVLDDEGPVRLGAVAWSVLAVPPLAWACIFFVHQIAVRRAKDPAMRRAASAYRRAVERLDTAARSPDLAHEEIPRAIGTYLSDRLNLPVGEWTPAEARAHAAAIGADHELSDKLEQLLERCDEARFARGGPDLAHEVPIARDILTQLHRATGKGTKSTRRSVAVRTLLAVTLIGCGSVRAENLNELDLRSKLDRAHAAFERGARDNNAASALEAFAEARAAYQELVAAGVTNGKLFYNLGNTHYRLGDLPRAILMYRRAAQLRPNDENIAANLAFARSELGQSSGNDQPDWRRVLLARFWSIRERTYAAGYVYVAAWILLILRVVSAWRWPASLAVVLLSLAALLGGSAWHDAREQAAHPLGVLTANDVIVRKGDGQTYEPQLSRPLGAGTEFRVLAVRGNWIEIELADGKSGWISSDEAAIAN